MSLAASAVLAETCSSGRRAAPALDRVIQMTVKSWHARRSPAKVLKSRPFGPVVGLLWSLQGST